ncbi:MAG: hypothetical protein ACRED5_17090 [Propylenella sp.]
MTSDTGIGVVLATIGLVTWIGLSVWGGLAASELGFRLREAWDIPTYFYVGLPVMAAAVAIAAFVSPERLWRWPLWLVGGHQLGVMLVGLGMQSTPSLLMLTIILAILLAAFFAIPAMLGAMAARALAQRAY